MYLDPILDSVIFLKFDQYIPFKIVWKLLSQNDCRFAVRKIVTSRSPNVILCNYPHFIVLLKKN